jgi:hypothetical protein
MALLSVVQVAARNSFGICNAAFARPGKHGATYSVDESGGLYIGRIYSVELLKELWTLRTARN